MTQLKNYAELHVLEIMNNVLSDTNVCLCELCTADIAAIALNNIPPKYFVTEKGELFSKTNSLQPQYEIDIVAAITAAAAQVKKNPRHKITGPRKNPQIKLNG
jgi:competence protein ComFB